MHVSGHDAKNRISIRPLGEQKLGEHEAVWPHGLNGVAWEGGLRWRLGGGRSAVASDTRDAHVVAALGPSPPPSPPHPLAAWFLLPLLTPWRFAMMARSDRAAAAWRGRAWAPHKAARCAARGLAPSHGVVWGSPRSTR